MAATVTLAAALPASAEEALVRGMGRTIGWRVAQPDGTVSFRDCQGGLSGLGDGRLEPTTGRCAGREPVRATGRLVGFEAATGVLRLRDAAGAEQPFFVPDASRAASAGLTDGRILSVSGPVQGHAAIVLAD